MLPNKQSQGQEEAYHVRGHLSLKHIQSWDSWYLPPVSKGSSHLYGIHVKLKQKFPRWNHGYMCTNRLQLNYICFTCKARVHTILSWVCIKRLIIQGKIVKCFVPFITPNPKNFKISFFINDDWFTYNCKVNRAIPKKISNI